MNGCEISYCPQCGANGVGTREVIPNHILELYCERCGYVATFLWQEHDLVGTTAAHDPDSDSEAW